MDTNSPGLETPENLIILGDEFAHDFPIKLFRCTFCKRGFSNAQALGGHMNIHRKDRAKLREFSRENFLSLEISKSTDWEESTPPDSSLGEKFNLENHQNCDDDRDESLQLPRRLPLFTEAPPFHGEELGQHVERRKVELKHGELDLELRLGPEPSHHAKSK